MYFQGHARVAADTKQMTGCSALHKEFPMKSSQAMIAGHAAIGAGSGAEIALLGAHLNLCNGLRGPWFHLQSAADHAHRFVAARFVTTLALATLFIGMTSLVS
jgi:hypothetical protein